MIGDYPITWLVTELLSIVLFSLCMIHALKQKDALRRTLELCCFVLGAAIFEHVGVLIVGAYDYDVHRIMMIGELPLSILLIEGITVYTGMLLFEKMNLPRWTSLWIVGFWCMFADFGIDPVYAFDTYEFDGVMRAQWNWAEYPLSFLNIPYFNFSGWLLMCGMYAVVLYYSRKIADKKPEGWFATAYPFVCGVLLIVAIAIFRPLTTCPIKMSEINAIYYQIVVLVIHFVVATVLYAKAWKTMEGIRWKQDWVIPVTMLTLDAYNLIVGLIKGLTSSYATTLIVMGLHIFYLWKLSKKQKA